MEGEHRCDSAIHFHLNKSNRETHTKDQGEVDEMVAVGSVDGYLSGVLAVWRTYVGWTLAEKQIPDSANLKRSSANSKK